MRTRLRSKGKGGSQSAIEASSVIPSTSGTRSRATAAPRMLAMPLTFSGHAASSTRPCSVSGRKYCSMIESPTATGAPCEARSSAIQRSMTISSGPGIASRPPCSSTRSPTGRLTVSMPTTVEYGMLAFPGLPSTSGVIAFARNASVGRPPSGPSTRSATRSAAGGSSSRREESRQAPLPAGVSQTSPRSSSEGLTAARKTSA